MRDKLKQIGEKAKETITSAAVLVGDLNGDGKVDEEDARIAAEWAKSAASSIADEAARLGKDVVRSEMTRDAATGAVIGAVAAIPLPVVGSMAGAIVGAGVGVYKNLCRKEGSDSAAAKASASERDIHSELIKLAELREKSIITDAEFEAEKKKILKS